MKILLLATNSETTNILINSLKSSFDVEVIFEEKVSKINFWRRRFLNQGFLRTLNQILFLLFIQSLKPLYVKNKYSFFTREKFFLIDSGDIKIRNVKSINSDDSIDLISTIDADIILINGTRILSKKLLDSIKADFINIHCGVTPKYRGVHGGYWAAYSQDFDNLGVTIHKVDKGVDTGEIIFQEKVEYSSSLNYFIYPLKQYSIAIPNLIKILRKFSVEGVFTTYYRNDLPSKLWYHPTLTSYLHGLIFRGIK